ncbi:NAD-dependent succinate-semialdehyde dehydrogenase, partial [Streptomyces sp. Ru73]|uniref:aldehyde dehydrogenase family protein n=1 Tax=Streptomyces sp. Ru73 TaxID=2080748 RepID=UPI000D418C78
MTTTTSTQPSGAADAPRSGIGVIDAAPKQLFLDGRWQDAAGGRTLPVDDPATGRELCQVADASPEDGRRALDAAVAAQPDWAATAPRARSEILRRAYELIIERKEDLALLMTLEMGKPLAEARGEVGYAAEFFRWFSEEAVRIDGGMSRTPDGANRVLVMRQPVGPCMLIT